MAQLTGSPQPVALGEGYQLRAPGIRGTADMSRPRPAGERSRSRAPEDGSQVLDDALAGAGMTEVRRIELRLQPTPPADATRSLRSVDGQEVLELQVPDLGPDSGQLVLACDETGVLTWHLPVDAQKAIETPASRGAGGAKRFLIPATQPKPPAGDTGTNRSLLGTIGRKLLKVLVYPITDPVIGAIGEFFAERWEVKKRPYGLRTFTPENRRTPGAGALAPGDWERLGSGRALLFVHGTFSTAHGAFDLLSDDTFATLYEHYQQRVFAFDHFTLSHDPRRNVAWLLEQVPAGRSLELDIVCHSRGGLVSRMLAERPSAFGLDNSRVRVRRIVFVAVPNQGTLLAQPDHMVQMIDRLTTALNLFPSGPVAETLEVLLTAIKVIGHGVLKGLDGLASMRPDGEFLGRFNAGTREPPAADGGYYAAAADYEPTHEGLKALVAGRIADAVIDRVFEHTANDLVVPEPGVYSAIDGNRGFPVEAGRLLRIPADVGVIHTTVFGYLPLGPKLLEWLV